MNINLITVTVDSKKLDMLWYYGCLVHKEDVLDLTYLWDGNGNQRA